ncbi:MAG: DegT/DnrJ/EryC1/StrS family aminotransferase [Candidatus Cloacimonetes bacterium]|nr:DegT/DnrJ/EryC1/StrS family aminotransferase [Candidatus Cloacimonadota bacterium]
MNIPFINLKAQQKTIEPEIKDIIQEVISSVEYINGKYNRLFCENFADFLGINHCIGVGNGTDGLEIALLSLNIKKGDQVIVPANSFIATAEAVTNIGAEVVFVDCDKESYCIDAKKIEEKINSKTRCIIPVHLYGHPADMEAIKKIAQKYNLYIIEDAAQAHGAIYNDQNIGTIGDLAVFSFYPGKNLGAYGDGGAVVTNDSQIAQKVKMLSNHGRIDKFNHKFVGRNSRLDNLQAAILYVKLKYLNDWNKKRIHNAGLYNNLLNSIGSDLICPIFQEKRFKDSQHVYHLYVVRVNHREALINHLQKNGINTGIHYPIGLPFLDAYKYLNLSIDDFPNTNDFQSKILSLPMCSELTEEQIVYISEKIGEFYQK